MNESRMVRTIRRAEPSGWWTGHVGLVAVVVATFGVIGCTGPDDALPRETVTGSITMDGRPLAQGLIQFVPDDPGAVAPTHVGTIVRDGRYDIPRPEGPVPGRYKVTISSGHVEASPEPVEDLPGIAKKTAPPRDLIPSAYNVRTTLQAVVKSDQENRFDFPLSSGKK